MYLVEINLGPECGFHSILNMDSGNNQGGSFPEWNHFPEGNSNSGNNYPNGPNGPNWSSGSTTYHSGGGGNENSRSDFNENRGTLNPSRNQHTSSVVSDGFTSYDPAADIPPRNKRELHSLILHRLEYKLNIQNHPAATLGTLFPKDTIIDKIAREMLFGHIMDNKNDLPTAYRQLNPFADAPRWSMVSISFTSPIIRSLENNF
jgi:hypothetical protein